MCERLSRERKGTILDPSVGTRCVRGPERERDRKGASDDKVFMDSFPDATTVRLKGPHGKYLWANDDCYRTSQHNESRNAQASWRVERHDEGGKKTVRLRSCYDTYLSADEHHFHSLLVLGFSGKKVVQMRPENVSSCRSFDWEPVMDGPVLKLKSCHGTFLRGNGCLPPWCNSVSHDLPRHERHQSWLHWEVEIVRVPKAVPLEILHATSNFKRPKVS